MDSTVFVLSRLYRISSQYTWEGKDAIPGESVYSSFVSALEKSRKIIVVLSNSFLQSDRCRGLADLAGTLFRCPG